MPFLISTHIMEKTKKEPYALLLNDLHVDKNTVGEFSLNWGEALGICNDRSIRRIIVGGDLWTNRAAQTLPVLLTVYRALSSAVNIEGFKVILAEGNHDLVDQEDTDGYSHLFGLHSSIIIVDDFDIYAISDELLLVVMSYFPENGSFLKRLDEVRERVDPAKTILYIHEGISGAISTSSDKELPASAFKGFRKVLVGHYHDRAQVGDNIFYIGASRQHNFGEDEEKGYTILYTDGSMEFVKNQVNTRYRTLTCTPEQLDRTMEKVRELTEEDVKVRLQIECQSEESSNIDRKALLEMGVSKVEVKAHDTAVESVSQAIEIRYDKDGIKKEYRDFCEKKEITDIEIGMIYLDKIN